MQKQTNPGNDLLRYAGLSGQILVALGIAVFAGYRLDKWLKLPFPLLVWALPLFVVSAMIYKLIKDTSKKKE
jgi:hypothetical protein